MIHIVLFSHLKATMSIVFQSLDFSVILNIFGPFLPIFSLFFTI